MTYKKVNHFIVCVNKKPLTNCKLSQKIQKGIVSSFEFLVDSYSDLLIKYIERIGLGPGVMGSSIFFLFNGGKLDINENRDVTQMGMTSGSTVIVLDIKGIIGS